jgi:hypothetical protein
MTKVELALILKIIDAHTVSYNPDYLPKNVIIREQIDSVKGLKEDIIMHYEEVMKNEGEDTV